MTLLFAYGMYGDAGGGNSEFHPDRRTQARSEEGDRGHLYGEILYEVTVTDPMLVKPFVTAPRTLRLSTNKDAGLLPERACCEVYETGKISTQLRH
jgi:hypothetical protein